MVFYVRFDFLDACFEHWTVSAQYRNESLSDKFTRIQ